PLALAAVRGLPPGALRGITHLVATSCTGFAAPGLDLQLIDALGLGGAVERTCVGFMGCYAAFNALKLARHVVRSEPGARVLLVNLELCTLHLQPSDDLEQLLSFLLFADGAAACVVSADPSGLLLDRFESHLVPDTAPLITWRIGDRGFDMLLSGRVPGAISRALSGPHRPALLSDPSALWAVHPGGRSVLDAVSDALQLPPDALADSRAVLRDHGNMSSGTILFVLARILAAAHPPGTPGLAMGFGPGLVAEFLRFRTA
ncbi:MAG: type III polyketide synthase, partial [Gluconacetobacter diazotrophicus]|nr:type III polyketide synthase [Gluconacetobacter diazotrophicus]